MAECGQRSRGRRGDELNLLRPGGNYGWPYVGTDSLPTGGLNGKKKRGVKMTRVPGLIREGKGMEVTGRHEGFMRSILAWTPSATVTRLVFNDKRWLPLWRENKRHCAHTGWPNCIVARSGVHGVIPELFPQVLHRKVSEEASCLRVGLQYLC